MKKTILTLFITAALAGSIWANKLENSLENNYQEKVEAGWTAISIKDQTSIETGLYTDDVGSRPRMESVTKYGLFNRKKTVRLGWGAISTNPEQEPIETGWAAISQNENPNLIHISKFTRF